MILPHSSVYLSDVRVNDIWFLLLVGALYEVIARLIVLRFKYKPTFVVQKEIDIKLLQVETDYKRSLGISAFVETSKLERLLLQQEQELTRLYKQRKEQADSIEKTLLKYGRFQITALLWFLYYSVPLLVVIDGVVDDTTSTIDPSLLSSTGTGTGSTNLLKTMLFPISYIGFGIRISRFGLPADSAINSLGALLVYWSSQVTAGSIMDAVEAYYVQ